MKTEMQQFRRLTQEIVSKSLLFTEHRKVLFYFRSSVFKNLVWRKVTLIGCHSKKQRLTSRVWYFTYTRNNRGSRKSMGFGVRHLFIQLILMSYCILRIVLGNSSEDKKDPCPMEIIF